MSESILKLKLEDVYYEEEIDIERIKNECEYTKIKQYYGGYEHGIPLEYHGKENTDDYFNIKDIYVCIRSLDKNYYYRGEFKCEQFLNNYTNVKIYNKYTDKLLCICTKEDFNFGIFKTYKET